MKKELEKRLVDAIDTIIVDVQTAARDDKIPSLQADEIIDGLLDSRHATTAQPAKEPKVEQEGAAA